MAPLQFQVCRGYAFCIAVQNGDAAFHAETRVAGVTRIKIKRSGDSLAKGLVGMAEDDDVGPSSRDAGLERISQRARIDDVMDEKFSIRHLDQFRFLELQPGVIRVA